MNRAEANAIVRAIRDLLEPHIDTEHAGSSFRNYDQPRDPATHIERLIANGAIPDRETLDAELAALRLNGDTADRLRELIPPSPVDDTLAD